jgi:hypothetical protein
MGLRAGILTLAVMMGLLVSLNWRHIGPRGSSTGFGSRRAAVGECDVGQPGGGNPAAEQTSRRTVRERPEGAVSEDGGAVGTRQRPLPAAVAFVQQRFSQVLVLDGSRLDALLRKTGLLQAAVSNASGWAG